MLRTLLLSPFHMLGRFVLGLIRFSIRVTLGLLRAFCSSIRAALLMAMAVALAHVGLGVLTGATNAPFRLVEGTVIGALAGTIYGIYRARIRPRALPTPAAFRPSVSQRLLRVGAGVGRTALMVPAVGLFFSAAWIACCMEWADHSSPAADPNPPRAAKSDLSIVGKGHPALTLGRAEAPAGADFHLQVRPTLLANLAKVYADPRFEQLFTARAEFQNTTDEPITGYRVRFRLPGYTADWSAWSGSAQVLPQQTVTTPYFPLLDEAKLAQLEGFALVDLQVEHEYSRSDGQLIQHREVRRLKVMARNWTTWAHTVPEDQGEAMLKDAASPVWRDFYATAPLLVPSLVTKDDPVIQQVAGWVSGQAGGAPIDDAGAQRFMQALYEFMVANGIRYQLPSVGERDGWVVQHVHFGRDVLRNRAGCCIDLSVFYASVCEAVGLEPVLILVPNHIFPAIRLPESKDLMAVEVTMVNSSRPGDGLDYLVSGYALATMAGQHELKTFRQGPHLEVDIVAQHKAGIQSLQLPPLPANVLASWGIHPVEPTPLWKALAFWVAVIGGLVLVRRLWQQRRLARQLRNAAPQVRFQAVAALARLRSRWSARTLTRTLQDSNEHVRHAAETALQARGEMVTVEPGLQQRPVGLPSLRASRRALLALAAGEFDTVVMAGRPPVAELSAS